MKNSKWILCILLSVVFFVVFTPLVYGDLYGEYIVESGGGVPDFIKKMPTREGWQLS